MHPSFPLRLLAALTLTLAPLAAQFQIPEADRSKAAIHSEVMGVAPGARFRVALQIELPDAWHSYYLNSGGVEQSLEIAWKLPPGFSHGPIQWPTPQVKDGYFGKSFIYSGAPVFLVEITAPADLAVGSTIELQALAKWQICENSCQDEELNWSLKLPVTGQNQSWTDNEALFRKAASALPQDLAGATFSATSESETIHLRITPASIVNGKAVDFIPDQKFVRSASSGGSIQHKGDVLLLTLPITAKDALDNPIARGEAFSGILLLEGGAGLRVPMTAITKLTSSSTPVQNAGTASLSLLAILGGMFLGGLILNLMPCVFPVIGLKIMGFVQQAGQDRRKIVLHGIVYTLGVLLSFGVLSLLLFLARHAGDKEAAEQGWAYWLQIPWVVLSLMILMFVLALNLYGVFEIGTSATSIGGSLQAKQGIAGSFFSGVLATVVASPCSAPFLGAAMGAAVGLPAVPFFTAFGAMALGLSTPYLLLSIFPKLVDLLPRPGAWMESFKQAMSFLLFATAGYLLWIYAGQIDLENLLGPIFGLSSIAIALWIHGRWNLPHRTKRARLIAMLLTLVFFGGGLYLAKPPQASTIEWKPWTKETEMTLLKEGSPVYIDFTAKWCATCQVNKKRAYTPEVAALMKKKGVVALKADKTKPNAEIDAAIHSYGRVAIPVNVLIAPGKEPIILPELLSPDDVLSALEKLK
ncbi:MAG TPA: protein-disulfide reductase DsbD domain-containing protein [Luteolibacter sp.]|nr:protein-disulfide reductase DsbD domain-containing protein [Luteolibacter sp.]